MLQRGLDNLVQWCNDWGMMLHPAKCVVMHFGTKNPHHDYYIAGSKINSEDVTHDLGVHVSVNCETSSHVEKIAKKAHGVLSQIHRATVVRDSQTFVRMYSTFVRPILESSAPAWNPHLRGDIVELEKVQKRAFRMISDMGNLSYEGKLKKLNVQSLESRRTRGDMIDTYKYLNGFYDIDPNRLFTFVRDRHNKDTRSYSHNCLVPEKTNLNIRKYFYTNRITSTWNSLPSDVKAATSVNNFKNLYDDYTEICSNLD